MVEDYSVSESMLEQVFLSFAKQQTTHGDQCCQLAFSIARFHKFGIF